MSRIVTVSGDRQAGKTHALLSVVGVIAMRGENALWVTRGIPTAEYHAQDLAELFAMADCRVHKVDGSPRVETGRGGTVYFRSAGQHGNYTPRYSLAKLGKRCAAVVFDDVDVPPGIERAFPDARIYVTETTGAAAGPERRAAALLRAARDFVHGEESCPAPRAGRCVAADCPVHSYTGER